MGGPRKTHSRGECVGGERKRASGALSRERETILQKGQEGHADHRSTAHAEEAEGERGKQIGSGERV